MSFKKDACSCCGFWLSLTVNFTFYPNLLKDFNIKT